MSAPQKRAVTQKSINNQIMFLKKKMEAYEKQNQESAAKIYYFVGQMIGTIIQVIMKQTRQTVFQILFERGIIIVLLGWIFRSLQNHKQKFYPPQKKKVLFLWLSVFALAISQPVFFMATRLISIAEAIVIQLTNTLQSQLLAFILLKEQLTTTRIVTILISLIGIIFICRPPFIFKDQEQDVNHLLGCFLAISSSFFQAVSFILVKMIGPSVNSDVKVQYYHLFCVVVSSLAFIQIEGQSTYSLKYLNQLALLSLVSYGCHYLIYRALTLLSYAKLAPLAFSQVVTSFLCDIFIFGQTASLLSIIGGLIVSFSICLSLKT